MLPLTNADIARIRLALQLSRAAYNFALVPTGPGWSKPAFILDHGFCASYEGTLYISFRGTRDAHDILTDLDADPTPEGIHSGFYSLYAALQGPMVDAMSSFAAMPTQWQGHSMGGSLALIGAASTPGAYCITFAAPRTFTEARALSLTLDGLAVINGRDIIPHQPWRRGWWNYRHVLPALRFNGDGFEWQHAHSLDGSYAPGVGGVLLGPEALD